MWFCNLNKVYGAAFVVPSKQSYMVYVCVSDQLKKKSALSICLCEYGIANKTNPILCNRVRDIDFPLLVRLSWVSSTYPSY